TITDKRKTQKLFAFLQAYQCQRMKQVIYQSILEKKQKGQKSFAVLIDPDKVNKTLLDKLIHLSLAARVDYLLVGGSLVISNHLDDCIQHIKKNCNLPVILFP